MMKYKLKIMAAAAWIVLASQPLARAEVSGYTAVAVPATSDVLLTVPFTQKAEAKFAVSSISVDNKIVISQTLTANQYGGGLYYIRFTTGAAKGLWSTIVSNGTSDFTIQDPSYLAGVVATDQFNVYRHQTLQSVFPDELEGTSYVKTTNLLNRLTEVLTFNPTLGINESAPNTYYYFNKEWRKAGVSGNFDNAILLPQQYFILRNKTGNVLTFVSVGVVDTYARARKLTTYLATADDVQTGNAFPVPMTLAKLTLGGTPAFVTTLNTLNRKDLLLVYNNSASGYFKAPVAQYFYYNGAWRKIGEAPSYPSRDNDVIAPGSAFVIRKAQGTSDNTQTWYQPSVM